MRHLSWAKEHRQWTYNYNKLLTFLLRSESLSTLSSLLKSLIQILERVLAGSLCWGTEWSPNFKIVGNIASLVLGVQLEVVLLALLCLSLDVQVLIIIPTNRLAFLAIESFCLLCDKFIESIMGLINSLLVLLTVDDSQHFVIVLVDVKLHWVLVVCEQRVVAVSQVSQSPSLLSNRLVSYEQQKIDLRCRRSSQLATCSTVVWKSDA